MFEGGTAISCLLVVAIHRRRACAAEPARDMRPVMPPGKSGFSPSAARVSGSITPVRRVGRHSGLRQLPPTAERAGQHAITGKRIAPLAPGANPGSSTRAGKTEKWFRRNCGKWWDECTTAEKGDVLAFLLSLK
jgi:hypothetical protein